MIAQASTVTPMKINTKDIVSQLQNRFHNSVLYIVGGGDTLEILAHRHLFQLLTTYHKLIDNINRLTQILDKKANMTSTSGQKTSGMLDVLKIN